MRRLGIAAMCSVAHHREGRAKMPFVLLIHSPISVMVRAALERVLGADRLDLWYERTAQKQYTRDLLFSSVYDLMNQVVFCIQPSVRAAYQAHPNDVGTSLVSVYNKLRSIYRCL
jgi:hypothetical protein